VVTCSTRFLPPPSHAGVVVPHSIFPPRFQQRIRPLSAWCALPISPFSAFQPFTLILLSRLSPFFPTPTRRSLENYFFITVFPLALRKSFLVNLFFWGLALLSSPSSLCFGVPNYTPPFLPFFSVRSLLDLRGDSPFNTGGTDSQ